MTETWSGPTGATGVADLLVAAGGGDQQAWSEIVRRFHDLVRSVTRSYRLQEADACDAEQRTWLRLIEHHGSVRDPERLGGWLATTAARECLRILRDGRWTVALEKMETMPDPDGDVEQRVVDSATADQLWQIVGTLPPRGRTVMHALFAGDPQPYAEVSARTGIPVGSLGPTRARVLDQVRTRFEGELAVFDCPPLRSGRVRGGVVATA